MVKTIAVGAFIFVAGFWSVLIGTILKSEVGNSQTKSDQATPDSSPTTYVSLITPSQAKKANLSAINGQVRIVPWDKFDPEPASTGSALFQGDEIITAENSSASITIDGLGQIDLSQGTNLQMASMVKGRITLRQVGGSSQYILSEPSEPLNIVVGRSLLEILSGSLDIRYENRLASISVETGEAKLGYYFGGSDTTKVWTLSGGDTARINDGLERVTSTGTLLP